MSTVLEVPAVAPLRTRRGSLLRAELHRFRSRRLIRVLLLLGVLAFVGGVVIAFTQFAKPSAAGLADAQARREQVVTQQEGYRQQCLSQVGRAGGPPSAEQCGERLTVDQVGDVDSFVRKHPFTLDSGGRAGVVGVAAATAALAFLLGATYVGAEWSSRSMVALLFWEPRRYRVMTTKIGVLVAMTALLGVLAEAAWLLAARVLAATRGTTAGPHGLVGELLGSAARGVLLVVLVALLGFGVANLLRNTAAAFGFGFVYFAILENVVRVLRRAWQPYLLTENCVALLTNGGLKLFLDEGYVDEQGVYQSSGREVVVSNLHGALVLGTVAAVVVGLGVVLFARRDLD